MYAIARLSRSKIGDRRSGIVSLLAGLLLGLTLSAWFWLPALGEANLVQLDNQTTGYFDYAEHFRSADLVQPTVGFDYAIDTAPGASTPFSMGLLQADGTLAGLVVMLITWRRESRAGFGIFALIGLAVSTVMITPLSQVLWKHLPLLPLTQFPWRFVSIQALFTSLVIGYIGALFITSGAEKSHEALGGEAVCGLMGVALAAVMLLPLRPDYLPIRADEIPPARLQLYEAFTGNIGATIRAEYLPRTAIPRPYTGPALIDPIAAPRVIVSTGIATATRVARASTGQTWQVNVETDSAVVDFPLLYWPGWSASIDGQSAEAKPAPDLGYVQVSVLRGEHRVALWLGRTPVRAMGEALSLVGLVLLVLLGVRFAIHGPAKGLRALVERLRPRPGFGMIVAVSLVAGLLALALQSIYAVPAGDADLTMDFVNKPWLHHSPDGVDFGLQARLMAYHIDQVSSESVTVSIDWQRLAAQDVMVSVALVTPSLHLFDGPSPIVEQTVPIQTGQIQYQLKPPYPLPVGMYYLRVEFGSIDVYLKPIWIAQPCEGCQSSRSSHTFGKLTPSIGLASVQVRHVQADRLDVLLQWSISGTVDANYGISLRLHDADGSAAFVSDSGSRPQGNKQWVALDMQPGYGFQPASAWLPGQLVDDAYTLSIPSDLPRDGSYALDVILYRVASQQEVGRTTIEDIRLDTVYPWTPIEPPARVFTVPPIEYQVGATFGDQIELLGYDMSRGEGVLALKPVWQALTNIDTNYKVFVHLFDPASEQIVAQSDAMPRANSYPTSRWVKGEIITDTIVIPLTGVPPGSYQLAIGLYAPPDKRLPVQGERGVDAQNRRVILAPVQMR